MGEQVKVCVTDTGNAENEVCFLVTEVYAVRVLQHDNAGLFDSGFLFARAVRDGNAHAHVGGNELFALDHCIGVVGIDIAAFGKQRTCGADRGFLINRGYAVDCWKRMFEIGELMDIRVFNTELGPGRQNPELCEAKLMRSLDELVPIMEEKGIRLDIQAHPDDFYEHNNDAYDIIRYYDSPSLGYLYSIPHTFHYDGGKGDIEHNLRYARKHLKHVLFADTYDYTKLFRYNINPAPLYANGTVRAHAHIGHLGEGDIDFDRIFKTLREIGFNQQDDTIATFNPLGFPERAISDGTRTREIIEKNLVGVPDITEPMPEDFGIYAR